MFSDSHEYRFIGLTEFGYSVGHFFGNIATVFNSINFMNNKNHFAKVDVWRSSYGPVSVKAIYELYRTNSGCSQKEFANTTFRDMVEFLRKLENPDYLPTELK